MNLSNEWVNEWAIEEMSGGYGRSKKFDLQRYHEWWPEENIGGNCSQNSWRMPVWKGLRTQKLKLRYDF